MRSEVSRGMPSSTWIICGSFSEHNETSRALQHTHTHTDSQGAAFAVKSKFIFPPRFAEFAIAQRGGIFSTGTLTFKTPLSDACNLVSVQRGPSSNDTVKPEILKPSPHTCPNPTPNNLSYVVHSEHDWLLRRTYFFGLKNLITSYRTVPFGATTHQERKVSTF